MDKLTVGTRELKNKLSAYLRRVKAGQTIIITERGKAIGQILPVGATLPERMKALERAGLLEWSGKKLKPRQAVIVNRGPKAVSDIVSEGRDVDYLP
jgi:prevent-host-death family protein